MWKAAAVVILALVAWAAVRLPGWLEERRSAQAEESAQSYVSRLTPERVLQLCGEPESQKLTGSSSTILTRTLIYNVAGREVQVSFTKLPGELEFSRPVIMDRELDQAGQAEAFRDRLRRLPCLVR